MKLLHDMIEDQKKELVYLVKKYGFRHQKVISVSQKLDLLVYKAISTLFLCKELSIQIHQFSFSCLPFIILLHTHDKPL